MNFIVLVSRLLSLLYSISCHILPLSALGRCLLHKPSSLLNLSNSYKILSTSADAQARTENSVLVSTLGNRVLGKSSLSGYTTATPSHSSGPSFPTPAWDEDNQDDGDVSEPELIDVSQLPKDTSSVFGYSNLG